MNDLKRVDVYGDSILKGIQLNDRDERYFVDNHIDFDMLCTRFRLEIRNFSRFGCTIQKAWSILQKKLDGDFACDAVVMDFGGNDCDFNWTAVANAPDDEHQPHTPLSVFVDTYHTIISALRQKGVLPILTTLPPLDAHRYLNWFCKGLNQDNIVKWLGDIDAIYRYQENYSRTVQVIAAEAKVPLVDLRGAFLHHRSIGRFLCNDGIHPNTEGQFVITQAFAQFAKAWFGLGARQA